MRIRIEIDEGEDGRKDIWECDTELSDVRAMEDVYLACKSAASAILDKVLG